MVAALPPLDDVATPELRAVLDRASAEAEQRGHGSVAVGHLLRAILAEPTGAEILRGAGADVDALDRELATILGHGTDASRADAVVVAARLYAHQHATAVSIPSVLMFVPYRDEVHVATTLARQGVTRYGVLRFVAHGIV